MSISTCDLGRVHQKEVGEEQCEGEPGQSLGSLRRLPVAFEILGEAHGRVLIDKCYAASPNQVIKINAYAYIR